MPTIDNLDIELSASAEKANRSLGLLAKRLQNVSTQLGMMNNTSSLSNLALGVSQLSSSMQSFAMNTKTADFNRLARNLGKIANIDISKFYSVSSSLSVMSNSITSINGKSIDKITQLANSIKQFGYASATKALANMPLLAKELKNMMVVLSTSPKISKDLISMTRALANLASQGSKVGSASRGMDRFFNSANNGIKISLPRFRSFASIIGTLYANFFLLRRVGTWVKGAIGYASDLTEVQNVVNTTFGDYKNVIEDMAKTSISNYGMSELTAKRIAGRFQAMGVAVGFSQKSMSDMSVSLTQLAGDMASFYNVEIEDVAESLESVFTGTTKPLRQYGLDVTEATLSEWAMRNGMEANIKTMTQAEKVMLRYNYVLSNTQNIQGDFVKTQYTFANQTRMLKQNFQAFSAVVGQVGVNVFRPFVIWANKAMIALTQFARVVSDSLGKIFGWQYEEPEGAVLDTGDVEDYADALDDAAGSAKNLKNQLQGFDKLNLLTTSSNSGGSGSGTSTSATSGSQGGWTKTEGIVTDIESEFDTLFKLGDHIQETITNSLNSINWDSIHAGAINFGIGLASFLNGFITPDLLRSVGKTIANGLNTAVYEVLAFGDSFDWNNLGNALAQGTSEALIDFDFGALARAFNSFANGFKTALVSYFRNLDKKEIAKSVGEFFTEIELDNVALIIAGISAVTLTKSAMSQFGTLLSAQLGSYGGIALAIAVAAIIWDISIAQQYIKAGQEISADGNKTVLQDAFQKMWDDMLFGDFKIHLGENFSIGLSANQIDAWQEWQKGVASSRWEKSLDKVFGKILAPKQIKDISKGLGELYTVFEDIYTLDFQGAEDSFNNFFDDIVSAFSEFNFPTWQEWKDGFVSWWNNDIVPNAMQISVIKITASIITKWSDLAPSWNALISNIKDKSAKFSANVVTSIETIKNAWNNIASAWKDKQTSFSAKVATTVNEISSAWNNLASQWKDKVATFSLKFSANAQDLKDWINSNVINRVNDSFSRIPILKNIKIPQLATGYYDLPEDGWFRASQGELMGQFDNGKSVVANNQQIVDGIRQGVRDAQSEQNSLLREQNALLTQILAKDVGISERDIFNATRRQNAQFINANGHSAFVY